MANQKVSELSGTVTAPADADLLLIENASAHKQMTFANLIANLATRYHPLISSPNTAFNKNFGTSASTVSEGDHSHSGDYEPADAAIVKSDEAETITSSWTFNAVIITKTEFRSVNPNNNSALVSLDWDSNIPRIRYGGSGTGSASGFQIQKTGDTAIASWDNSGNLTNLGTITAPNMIDAASDRELKKNIEEIKKSDIGNFDKINAVSFEYKEAIHDINKDKQFGVIAQELKELYPSLVYSHNDSYGVNYQSLAMLTLSKVQAQQKEINELRELINGLIEKIK